MYFAVATHSHPFNWAIWISLAALALSIASIVFNIYAWFQSGGKIKTKVWVHEVSNDRLKDIVQVEVISKGRQPAVVRQIDIGHRHDTGKGSGNNAVYVSVWDKELSPVDGRVLPLSLPPTSNVVAQIEIGELVKTWGYNTRVLVIARAIRGDGKVAVSKVISVKTPHK